VTVGENSVIGAFSFVTGNIPENVIAYGVPARVARRMTDDEIRNCEEETR
jgi:acetyltransferase-like isoleucine patch superfamily enzyme